MTKLAIWAAIFSAFSWFLNSTLTDPKLVEVAQAFNKWAASFALLSAIALLVAEHWKDYKRTQQEEDTRKKESFDRVVSGNPETLSEYNLVDRLTKPGK
ncbi:hypothetical protein [Leisingera sp.]|uniref:hypothetical protein n=1 Tax=Leisingera sp. TaxID=1879318 RepID=UPI003A930BC1